ncbi:MAG TPA: DUF3999 family protein [Candidatus Acidoferrales bacterium]|nr:DUF3999 family protein [Candidatus Acidoferrales bacterium]
MTAHAGRRTSGSHDGFLVAAFVCALGVLGASLPPAWQHWRYSRAIDLPATQSPRLVSLKVPQNVYAHAAPGLADLRVIDETGAEVPYALRGEVAPAGPVPSQSAAILENSFAPGHYTQLVLDLKDVQGFHSSIQIDTPEREFMEWVEVAASDDARVWRTVQERAPIFRFPREGHSGTTTVSYSPNNARYLRLRILDGDKQFPVMSARILFNPVVKPQKEPLRATFVPASATAPNETAWSADLGASFLPVSEVRFQVGRGEFVREVTIESSRDGSQWYWVGSGEVYRFAQGGRECEQLTVPTEGNAERYLRVEIANGNDKPLPGVAPAVYIATQQIAFEQSPDRTYRLLYGDSAAKTPQYDLSRRVDSKQVEAALVAQAGTEEINSDWADPRPWTETHKFVLWLGVALAVLLIGFAAIQSLRRSSPSTGEAHDS